MENVNPEQKDNVSKFLRSNLIILMLLINSYFIILIFMLIPAQMNIPQMTKSLRSDVFSLLAGTGS